MSQAQAVALRMPLRLLHTLQSLLESGSSGALGGAKPAEVPDGQLAAHAPASGELRGDGSGEGAAPAERAEELSTVEQASAVVPAEKAVAAMPEVEPSIELRRCPKREVAVGSSSLLRVTARRRLPQYALKVTHSMPCACAGYAHSLVRDAAFIRETRESSLALCA
jgi:hypothetical protein